MLYKFTSPATGDLIMLGPQGDQMLRLLGREPAARGIIETADMPAAIAALQAAIDAEGQAGAGGTKRAVADGDPDEAQKPALRQRLWPVIEMLRRAQAADAVVVWGV